MCASCVIQEIRVVSVSEIENKRYQLLCGYTSPLVQKLCQSVLLCFMIAYPNSARVNIDVFFCRRYELKRTYLMKMETN